MARPHNKSEFCLNCNARIGDANYCPRCGQLNTDKQVPVKQFVHDAVGDYLTFDSRFFRSFVPLLFKPGYLTNEYITGRRVSYIFPFRLYLFISFLFFFTLAIKSQMETIQVVNPYTNTEEQLNKLDDLVRTTLPDLSRTERETLKAELDSAFLLRGKPKDHYINIDGDKSSHSTLEKILDNKIKKLASEGKTGPKMFLKSMIDQIPKIMFFLLPLFALLLKLFYIRHKILYINHFVFALHIHAVFFLYLLIPVFIPDNTVFFVVIILLMVYQLLAFRRVYRQSYVKTIVKLNLIWMVYFFLIIFAILLSGLLALASI
ncbi:MAG TPA: DUF3667 domain-containing protein [Caldithrix abyssi]|uniref:DUF3667 domain-containing protein n=1 Tax=Caldithrix abyssi TaxID=187145 RepID=A0A7V4TYS3_CALAY|nr:DUF3667 domain-containing protein [Caldithrix abyssi]